MSRYCQRCGRAQKACICPWIEPVESQVEVIILQHPSEVNQAKGTAKIVELSVSPSQVFVGEDFSGHDAVNALINEPDTLNLLLFPSEHSCLLGSDSDAQVQRNVRLWVLDGTWKKAFKMYQLSTNLHTLARVHLPEDLLGRYTIRKAPRQNALSTVEAVYHGLTLLKAGDVTPLITAFDKMIEHQIAQLPDGVFERHFGHRRR